MATNKYIVTFDRFPMVFSVNYTAGKLNRIEHKRGNYNTTQWSHLTKAIPYQEKYIPEVRKKHENRISFEQVVKDKSQYQQFMEVYLEWHIERDGFGAKIDGKQGKGLKEIIKYLNENSETNEQAFDTWSVILARWDNLEDFYQKQNTLAQINSNIQLIIKQIKDDTTNTMAGTESRSV